MSLTTSSCCSGWRRKDITRLPAPRSRLRLVGCSLVSRGVKGGSRARCLLLDKSALARATGTTSRWTVSPLRGIPLSIPPDAGKRRTARPGVGRRAVHLDALPARDEKRSGFHRKRQVTVELVFAQRVFNHTLTRFHRRARAAMHSESRLMAAGHNLLKLHTHRIAPAGT